MGARIEEIPASWYDRTEGKSRFRLFAWLPLYLRWLLSGQSGAASQDNSPNAARRIDAWYQPNQPPYQHAG